MLRISAPTVQDRANQWVEAYDAAETLVAKAFKDCPQLLCHVNEASLDLVCEVIRDRHAIPFQIIAAAVLTVVRDIHEQYHNQV